MGIIKHRRASVALFSGLLVLAACGEAASEPSAPQAMAPYTPDHIERRAVEAAGRVPVHYPAVSPDKIERRTAVAKVHYSAVSADQVERRALAEHHPAWWAQRR